MFSSTFATLAEATDVLAIHAFDRFRDAAHRADMPLAFINAFAEYKAAVGFALQAAEADAAGDIEGAAELLHWGSGALAEMDRELAALERL